MNPGTTIEIGNFPKPPGPGNHCIRYDTAAEQYSSVHSYMDATFTSSTYVRPERGWFDIDAYAPSIKYANYGMFENPNDRRYYFDIADVEYVNENVTRVHFSIDLLATYMFDYARTSQRVLREHVDDDTVGANIQPEPVGTGELTYTWFKRTASAPHSDVSASSYSFDLRESAVFIYAGDQADGNKVYAGVLDGTVEGACCWVAPLPIQEDGDYFTGHFTDWIWSMNRNNKAESIVAMTMFPLDLLPSGIDRYNVTPLFGDSGDTFNTQELVFKAVNDNEAVVLQDYTPRNNKLFTYPYCFMRVTNNRGQYHDYRYEFFGIAAETGKYTFALKGTPDPAGDIWCMPVQYNNANYRRTDDSISLGGIPQISWPYNSYQNWLAGNAGSLAMNLLSAATMFIPGIGAIRTAGVASKLAGAVSTATRSAVTRAGSRSLFDPAVKAAGASVASDLTGYAGMTRLAGQAMLGSGAAQLGNTAATLYDQSNVPDGVRGQATNPSTLSIGAYGFTFYGMSVRPEFARAIDDFFQVYGYAVNENKVPNETGRKNYNFVQTENAAFRANSNAQNTLGVPATAMAAINAMYDEGIWFWHDPATAGDFTDDNPIV